VAKIDIIKPGGTETEHVPVTAPANAPVSRNGLPIGQAPKASKLVRLAVTMALVGCVIGMGFALSLHQETKGPADEAIERLTPTAGAETVPGQTPIIVDLAYGYDCDITLDGIEIPKRDVIEDVALAQFKLKTNPSAPLTNSLHVMQIVYWPKIGDKKRDAQFFQWSFKVV
jgi:hypothetical protein